MDSAKASPGAWPKAPGPWSTLAFHINDLVACLRTLEFPENFVQRAVVAFIGANPVPAKADETYWLLTQEQNEEILRACNSVENGNDTDG